MNKQSSIIIYTTEDGNTHLQVKMENETVWLTQSQMAELFQTDRTSIVRHINNIYKTEELDRESTCAKIAQVQMEGKFGNQITCIFCTLKGNESNMQMMHNTFVKLYFKAVSKILCK